jgi:hypothetical protein
VKITLNENEKDQISSQHEEIDSRLFNFLLRRIKVEEREIGVDLEEIEPLKVKDYTFEGYPGYGFNTWATKKLMEKKIIDMLYENDIIDYWPFELELQDSKRVKIFKKIRKFLNFILSGKK